MRCPRRRVADLWNLHPRDGARDDDVLYLARPFEDRVAHLAASDRCVYGRATGPDSAFWSVGSAEERRVVGMKIRMTFSSSHGTPPPGGPSATIRTVSGAQRLVASAARSRRDPRRRSPDSGRIDGNALHGRDRARRSRATGSASHCARSPRCWISDVPSKIV
jgi:hypothetical protein